MQMKLGFKLQVDKNRVVRADSRVICTLARCTAVDWTAKPLQPDEWHVGYLTELGKHLHVSMEWLLQYCSVSCVCNIYIYIVLIQSLSRVFTMWIIRMKPAKLPVLTCAWYICWWNCFYCKAVFNEDGVRKNVKTNSWKHLNFLLWMHKIVLHLDHLQLTLT